MSQSMSIDVTLNKSFEESIEAVTAALKSEGFGVLTSIDVSATLKQKIDVEFRPYTILGACHPHSAYQVLSSDPRVGLMLPCNVVVQQAEGGVLVSLIDPAMMMSFGDLGQNKAIGEVAASVREKFMRVAAALGA